MKRLFASLLLLGLSPVLRADVSPSWVELSIHDQPLVIKGWLGQADTFAGNLRLTNPGMDTVKFNFLPSDLKLPQGDEEIRRDQVVLAGDPTLPPGESRNFLITVTAPKVPGTYEGEIELAHVPRKAGMESVKIPLKVVARVVPILKLASDVKRGPIQLVREHWLLDRWMAWAFLPESERREQWPIQLENPLRAPVKIGSSILVDTGTETDQHFWEGQVELPSPSPEVPGGEVASLPLTLKRSLLSAGHYRGDVRLSFEGVDQPFKVPVEVNVRWGPSLALALLLLGVGMGRFVKYMQDRGQPQAAALGAYYGVTNRVRQADPADRAILDPMLTAVRQDVEQEQLADIPQRLATIRARLDALQELRQIEASLAGGQGDPRVQNILQQILQARTALSQGLDAQAQALLGNVRMELVQLHQNLVAGAAAAGMAAHVQAASHAAQIAANAAGRAAGYAQAAAPAFMERARAFIEAFTGIYYTVRAQVTYWVLQVVFWVLFILILLAVGFKTQYIDKGATFGSQPFSDCLALLAWGLSADVVGRNITSVFGKG